eukprot:352821-Chlamydomonas_euryale.AAC.12
MEKRIHHHKRQPRCLNDSKRRWALKPRWTSAVWTGMTRLMRHDGRQVGTRLVWKAGRGSAGGSEAPRTEVRKWGRTDARSA